MPVSAQNLLITSIPVVSAVGQYVPIAADGTVASAGAAAIGLTTTASEGNIVPVCVVGSGAAWAGATISRGQAVQVGANGTVVPQTTGVRIGTALTAAVSGDQVEVLIAADALVSGGEILQRGSTPVTTPTFGGTGGAISFGGKKRRMDWAGVSGRYVFREGTMHMGDLQFGTRTTDTPASQALSAYAADIESGGAQPELYTPTLAAGTLSIAGGRFRHRADGSVRIMHYADDALYSSSPRLQFTSFQMPNRVKLLTRLVVQFGDDETPWPVYVAGRQSNLFWQIKGSTGQPPLGLSIERQADGSLKLYLNRKRSNATGIFTAATVSGLREAVPISIDLAYTLDWLTLDEGGAAELSLTVNGKNIEIFDQSADSEGVVSVYTPTVFTDVSQAYTMINGIYRYDYHLVKAPNDCAMIYWLHETSVRRA